jgi:poly(3-hydroxybutyrate) depolymerase
MSRHHRRAPILILLALLPGLAWSAVTYPSDASFSSGTVTKTGSEPYNLPYRLFVPTGYSAASSYPLIVFMHGIGELGTNNTAQMGNHANGATALVSAENQAVHPCFMILPQAHDGWDAATFGQIVRLIGQLESTYSIDPDRIYATGLSLGGAGTWSFITQYPALFAAAVPQSGWGAGNYDRIVSLPVWNFHAANDGTVNVSGSDDAVRNLRAAGGRVIYTRYDTGGHGIWPVAYQTPALLPWMMAQRRNQPVAGTPILTIATPAADAVANAGATITLTGSSAFPSGSTITQVRWTSDLTTFTTASGTTAWSASSLAVPTGATLFSVLATGPSWSTGYGGLTTVSDRVRVVRGSSDVTAPAIAITAPTASGSAAVGTDTATVGGTASDTGGIQQVTWVNDRGGQGTAQGTTSWSIAAITLAHGANVITVTARDGANLTRSATITITTTGGSGGGGSQPASSSSSSHKCGFGAGVATFALMLAAGLALRRSRRW